MTLDLVGLGASSIPSVKWGNDRIFNTEMPGGLKFVKDHLPLRASTQERSAVFMGKSLLANWKPLSTPGLFFAAACLESQFIFQFNEYIELQEFCFTHTLLMPTPTTTTNP